MRIILKVISRGNRDDGRQWICTDILQMKILRKDTTEGNLRVGCAEEVHSIKCLYISIAFHRLCYPLLITLRIILIHLKNGMKQGEKMLKKLTQQATDLILHSIASGEVMGANFLPVSSRFSLFIKFYS